MRLEMARALALIAFLGGLFALWMYLAAVAQGIVA